MQISVRTYFIAAGAACVIAIASFAPQSTDASEVAKADELLRSIEPQVVAWRRDLHQNPELSNREFRTAKLVAEHLKKLGLEVQTGIAHTGVVGLLKGGHPGPTVALRADMDALPVTEKTNVPFKSRVTADFRGEKVGVMHACGHDTHVAILMGVAQTLTKLRASLHGNVLFIFQPAEEGAPAGEEGGAQLMLKEGLFEKYKPDLVYGLHAWAALSTGQIGYRSGPLMAAVDSFRIDIQGKQAHGSRPWSGVDPIVTAAQTINAIQTIVSRGVDITENPAVVTVGAIKGGIRHNIIPDRVEMIGTLRTFDPRQRGDILEKLQRIVESTAAANGATGKMALEETSYPVTYNNPELTEKSVAVLKRLVGEENVKIQPLTTGAEDFSFFANKIPGFYFFIGVTPQGTDPATAPSNHSDYFYVDEKALPVGTRALTQLALNALGAAQAPSP